MDKCMPSEVLFITHLSNNLVPISTQSEQESLPEGIPNLMGD